MFINLLTPENNPQAHVGLERGASCFKDPVYPDDDGQELLPYTGENCLTYEGEINKMAVNIAFGRYTKRSDGSFDGQFHWYDIIVHDNHKGLESAATLHGYFTFTWFDM